MIELLVVVGLLATCVGFALHSLWYNTQAAQKTNRVADLHEVRRMVTHITRDLERAVVLERPGWASNTSDLIFLDGTHRTVSYHVEDDQGTRLASLEEMKALPADQPVHLVRSAFTSPSDVEVTRIDRGVHLGWIRFYRLGRSLLGVRMALKPRPGAVVVEQKQGEEFAVSISLNRQVH